MVPPHSTRLQSHPRTVTLFGVDPRHQPTSACPPHRYHTREKLPGAPHLIGVTGRLYQRVTLGKYSWRRVGMPMINTRTWKQKNKNLFRLLSVFYGYETTSWRPWCTILPLCSRTPSSITYPWRPSGHGVRRQQRKNGVKPCSGAPFCLRTKHTWQL